MLRIGYEWYIMLSGALVYAVCAYLSFSDYIRQQKWYIPLGMFLGIITSGLWFAATKVINDKQRIYAYSIYWDAMLTAIYYFMPLIFLGVRLNRWSALAISLIIIGLIIIKFKA